MEYFILGQDNTIICHYVDYFMIIIEFYEFQHRLKAKKVLSFEFR